MRYDRRLGKLGNHCVKKPPPGERSLDSSGTGFRGGAATALNQVARHDRALHLSSPGNCAILAEEIAPCQSRCQPQRDRQFCRWPCHVFNPQTSLYSKGGRTLDQLIWTRGRMPQASKITCVRRHPFGAMDLTVGVTYHIGRMIWSTRQKRAGLKSPALIVKVENLQKGSSQRG